MLIVPTATSIKRDLLGHEHDTKKSSPSVILFHMEVLQILWQLSLTPRLFNDL